MNNTAERKGNWLDDWLAEGNSIEHSGYYLEKQKTDREKKITPRPVRALRKVNSYIVNRDYKRRVLDRFVLTRRNDKYRLEHPCWRSTVFVRVSPKAHHLFGSRFVCEVMKPMMEEKGHIDRSMLYLCRSNNHIISISAPCKRYVKNRCNRIVRRSKDELAGGRYVYKITSRYYGWMLEW